MQEDPRFVHHAYTDRLQEDIRLESESDQEPSRASSSFPGLLYFILRTSERNETQHIVSWQPHGRSFMIRDKNAFVSQIMSRYFSSSRFASFQKQLNVYGFMKMARDPDAGGWYHEYFLRGRPDLLIKVKRIAVNGRKVRRIPIHESEPNFYSMPYSDDVSSGNEGSENGTDNASNGSGTNERNPGCSAQTCSSQETTQASSSAPETADTITSFKYVTNGDFNPTVNSNPSHERNDQRAGPRENDAQSASSQLMASCASDAATIGSQLISRRRDNLGVSLEYGNIGVPSEDQQSNLTLSKSISDARHFNRSSPDDDFNCTGDFLDRKQGFYDASTEGNRTSSILPYNVKQNASGNATEGKLYGGLLVEMQSSSGNQNNDNFDAHKGGGFTEEPDALDEMVAAMADSTVDIDFDFGDLEPDPLVPTAFATESAEAMYTDLSAQGLFFPRPNWSSSSDAEDKKR